MKNVLLLLIHLLTVVAKLLGPGGIKGIIAENLLLKQQLLVVCRPDNERPIYSQPIDSYLVSFLCFSGPAVLRKSPWVFGPRRCFDFMTIWFVGNIGTFTHRTTEANLDPKVRRKNLSKPSSNSNTGIRALDIHASRESCRKPSVLRLTETSCGAS